MKKFTKFLFLTCLGWSLAQYASAQTWMQTSLPTSNYYEAVAMNADGSKIYAAALGWNLYLSTNSGATWATNTEPQVGSQNGSWNHLACSADGNTVIGLNGSSVWTSTNGGVSWISNNVPGAAFFSSLALSADGAKVVATDNANAPGLIYVSTNSGMTWQTGNAPARYWNAVASSADGTKLAALAKPPSGANPDPIYISTNSGLIWSPANVPAGISSNIWTYITCSSDGTKLLATTSPILMNQTPPYSFTTNRVYTSADQGVTWTERDGLPPFSWSGAASSADGSHLVVICQSGGGIPGIYTSTDFGATWVTNSSPSQIWWSVASSADGCKLAAVSVNGPDSSSVSLAQTVPSPQLTIAATNGLQLSWTIPSTNLGLQQRTDLSSGTWADITNQPVLNLTNLQNQVTLLVTNASGFYRLH